MLYFIYLLTYLSVSCNYHTI